MRVVFAEAPTLFESLRVQVFVAEAANRLVYLELQSRPLNILPSHNPDDNDDESLQGKSKQRDSSGHIL